jgi:hypothetical protein
MANQVKSKYERTRMRYDNVQKAKIKSQLENKQRQLVNKSHTFDSIIISSRIFSGTLSAQLNLHLVQLCGLIDIAAICFFAVGEKYILAYLAIAGHGHYDACIKPAIAGRTQLQNSPSKIVEETANMRNTHAFLTISFYV